MRKRVYLVLAVIAFAVGIATAANVDGDPFPPVCPPGSSCSK